MSKKLLSKRQIPYHIRNEFSAFHFLNILLCHNNPTYVEPYQHDDNNNAHSIIQNCSKNCSKSHLSRKEMVTHYSKSQFFVKIWQNPNIFTSFHQFFFCNFFVKSKLSTAKKSKTTTFSRVFHSTIFSANQRWIFGHKMKISNSVDK